MKKVIKGMLISSGAFLVVGLALLLSGFLLGATWSQVGNALTSGRYSFGNRWSWYNHDDYDEDDSRTISSGQYDLKDIKKLSVNMAAGDLKIKTGNTNKFEVENDQSRGRLLLDESGDSLDITFKGRNWRNGGKATLWVPKDFEFEAVDLYMGAGNMTIDTLHAKNLEVEVAAGNLECNGKIYADKSQWEIRAGHIKTKWLDSNQTNLVCSAGELKVGFAGSASNYNLEGECTAGEVKYNGDKFLWDSSIEKTNNNAKRSIDVDCTAGKINIDFED